MIWTVLFVVAVMVLGCVLFSVHDWGRPSGNRGRCARMRRAGRGELRIPPSGVGHGKYLPPVYLREGGRAHPFPYDADVMSTEEFSDMIERS